MPRLTKIDHVHIYVSDRVAAEAWYRQVLGFERVASLAFWAQDGGPLTLANGDAHLALFEHPALKSTTVAFAVDAAAYREWKQQLQAFDVDYTENDHQLSWSIYFSDPDGNPFEITCYDYDKLTE